MATLDDDEHIHFTSKPPHNSPVSDQIYRSTYHPANPVHLIDELKIEKKMDSLMILKNMAVNLRWGRASRSILSSTVKTAIQIQKIFSKVNKKKTEKKDEKRAFSLLSRAEPSQVKLNRA